jgi:hypothetical protein
MNGLTLFLSISLMACGFDKRHHTPTPTPVPTASVTVSWTATPGDSYRLFYARSTTFGAGIDVGTASSYTVKGLTIGQTYYFTLTARNAKGESTKAAPVQYKPLSAKPKKLKLPFKL